MTIKREKVVLKREVKADPKQKAKDEVMEVINTALEQAGYKIHDGVTMGMTKGTIVVEHKDTDVQIKPIVPKAGVTRYDIVKEE